MSRDNSIPRLTVKSDDTRILAAIDYPKSNYPQYRARLCVMTGKRSPYVWTNPIDAHTAYHSACCLYNAHLLLNKLNSSEIILPDFDAETQLAAIKSINAIFE